MATIKKLAATLTGKARRPRRVESVKYSVAR